MFSLKLLSAQPSFQAKYLFSNFNVPSGPYDVWQSILKKDTIINDTIYFSTGKEYINTQTMFFYNNAYYDYLNMDTTMIFNQNTVRGDSFQVVELQHRNSGGNPREFYDTGVVRIDSVYLKIFDDGKVRKVWDFILTNIRYSYSGKYTWIEDYGTLQHGVKYLEYRPHFERAIFLLIICDSNQIIYHGHSVEPRCDSLYWWQRINVSKVTKKEVKIYPNPVNAVINMENLNNPMALFSIISSTGNTVITGKLDENKIDVSTLPKGIYILKIKTKDYEHHLRFLKE